MLKHDLTGKQAGYWTIFEQTRKEDRHQTWYRCVCRCGKESIKTASSLIKVDGRIIAKGCKSCAVSKGEYSGLEKERCNWKHMISRCHNPKDRAYAYYGGRGIQVCDRWRNSFWDYLSDVGQFIQGFTLDRIDNNQGYSPENCRWVNRQQQACNRRSNKWIIIGGEKKILGDWLVIYGVSRALFGKRIGRGMTEVEALTTPIDKRFSNNKRNCQT